VGKFQVGVMKFGLNHCAGDLLYTEPPKHDRMEQKTWWSNSDSHSIRSQVTATTYKTNSIH